VRVRWTGRSEGDLRPGDGCVPRWQAVVARPWSWARQVHGSDVLVVGEPGELPASAGDALVSAHPDACLAVFTADCAPVVLGSPEGIMAVAHAGWRGLLAGVLQATAEAMRSLGASSVVAGLGPCIHPGCYEFSPADLDRVAAAVGDVVRGRTSSGRPALDLPAGVRAALTSAGVDLAVEVGCCTACSPELFSHRGKGDRGRQAVVAWRA